MIQPQSLFAVKQEADRSLPLPTLNTFCNIKKEGKHTRYQELDVAASLQHLKISCPRYVPPLLSDWMRGMFSVRSRCSIGLTTDRKTQWSQSVMASHAYFHPSKMDSQT